LGTDAGEHDDFRIGRAGLLSCGADEGSVSLRVVLKSPRLNVDDVGIVRGVASNGPDLRSLGVPEGQRERPVEGRDAD
jgi:hypothetical protein